MASMEDAFATLARTFARDLVAALRAASLDEIIEATRSAADAVEAPRATARARTPTRPTRSSRAGIDAAIAETARTYRLTARETTIMKLVVEGKPRGAIAEALGVPENTLKTQARVLLRKVRADSLSAAAIVILRRALASGT